MKILFSKIRNVKSPSVGTPGSAGLDFYVPERDDAFDEAFVKKNGPLSEAMLGSSGVFVKPGRTVAIPSGIRLDLSGSTLRCAALAVNKSGVSLRTGLVAIANLVDQDYQGELHLCFANCSDGAVIVEWGTKAVQFVLLPYLAWDGVEVPDAEMFPEKTQRGEGGFGSTGAR